MKSSSIDNIDSCPLGGESIPEKIENFKLVKKRDISKATLGRLKSRSSAYQIEKESALYESILIAIYSTSTIRRDRTSGKLIISLNLGGVQGIEFQDTEYLK